MLGNELLQSARVRLAPMEKDAFLQIEEWHTNDLETMRYLRRGLVMPESRAVTERWFEKLSKQEETAFVFSIRLRADDSLLGGCGLKEVMWQARHAEVWITLSRPDSRGQGYGTEAMEILLRYAFMELNLNRVGLVVAAYNQRARASYEKCGFVLEGTLRENMWRDGEYHDLYLMGILRREWAVRQPDPAQQER
ncbi:MAG: GNAT family N-acetyltransferase [Anaerolineae bacterium]|nr:GNAT family N-acetyltransferase [Anaerolineae bacterium]